MEFVYFKLAETGKYTKHKKLGVGGGRLGGDPPLPPFRLRDHLPEKYLNKYIWRYYSRLLTIRSSITGQWAVKAAADGKGDAGTHVT